MSTTVRYQPAMDSDDPTCNHKDIACLDGSLVVCMSCGSIVPIDTAEPTDERKSNEDVLNPGQMPTRPLSWPTSVKYAESIAYDEISKALQLAGKKVSLVRPTNFATKPEPQGYGAALESEPFTYQELQGPTQIRVLQLSPGHRREVLHGRLLVTDLNESPCYGALSYTWADDKNDSTLCRRIFLGDDYRPLPITLNCDRALRSLRQRDCHMTIWIDSVCINQSSLAERSNQVSLMHGIYSSAENVHVYVGEDACGGDETGDQAIRHLSNLDALEADGVLARPILDSFFCRPYFSRLWVVQEVLLARSIMLHCGELSIPFSRGSIARLEDHLVRIPPWIGLLKLTESSSATFSDQLVSLLSSTTSCEMSDFRDRVFGLLGLIDDTEVECLNADYSLMVREVYIGVAAYLLLNKGQFHILQLAGTDPDSSMAEIYGIPSWVPLWRSQTATQARFDAACMFQRLEEDFEQFIAPRDPRFKHYNVELLSGQCLGDGSPIPTSKSHGLAVHATTGSLIASGYEVLSLGKSFLTPLDNRDVRKNLQDEEILTDFWEFDGGTILAVRAPAWVLAQTCAKHHLVDNIRVVKIQGCQTLFLATKTMIGDSQTAYRLLSPCIVGVIYQRQGTPAEKISVVDDERLMHQFYPLRRSHLRFLFLWRRILTLAAQPQDVPGDRPYSSGSDPDFAEFANSLAQSDDDWGHYHDFTTSNGSPNLGADFMSSISILLRFWDNAALISASKMVAKNTSISKSIAGHFRSWTSAMSCLNIAASKNYHMDRFNTSVGYFALSTRLENALETWRTESKHLSKLLEGMLGLNFIVWSHGRAARITPALVDQAYDLVHSHLKICDDEDEIIERLSQTTIIGSADWRLSELMISSLVESPDQFAQVERILTGRQMVHGMFAFPENSGPIVIV